MVYSIEKTVLSENDKFDDFEEIKHVAKHELGHDLGMEDLYKSRSDDLGGVSKGTYAELDGYYLTDKFYNLVMCDHHGPISNNDVEIAVRKARPDFISRETLRVLFQKR